MSNPEAALPPIDLSIERICRWQLIEYLTSHESDIAYDINDFGDLKEVFIFYIGRPPVE
jgi:hypothetical protein